MATQEPVPQPTLAADTVDGEDRFVNRRERLNGEPTARYLHADDLVTYRLRRCHRFAAWRLPVFRPGYKRRSSFGVSRSQIQIYRIKFLVVRTAYKCRAYPDQEQTSVLNRTFGCIRVVWNQTLAWRRQRCQAD